jgi:sugar lactone lactonase YvrE
VTLPRSHATLVAAFLLLLAAAPASAGNRFYDDLRAARALAARGDLPAARSEFARLDSLAIGLPATTYALAQIAGRLGNRAEALRRLRTYAAMGLSRAVARDSSFASLFADSAFVAVARRLEANATPVTAATIVTVLHDPSLLAEDLAYDARSRTFYVSSIHRGTIVAVDSTGSERDFIPPGSERGWGVFGLALDRARGLLWGSLAATPTVLTYVAADSGRTGIAAWDLATGARRTFVELPPDGSPHILGDIALGSDGTLFATESIGGALYALRPGGAALDTLAAPGTFGSPQMPLEVEPGRRLWIADYPRGILEFDLKRRAVRRVVKPRALALSGLDGLALGPDGVVAVQNGTRPTRVLYLETAGGRRSITAGRILERASELMGEPNHAIVDGGTLYFIGNSGWDRVNGEEILETPEGSTSPMILQLRLPGRADRGAGPGPGGE